MTDREIVAHLDRFALAEIDKLPLVKRLFAMALYQRVSGLVHSILDRIENLERNAGTWVDPN